MESSHVGWFLTGALPEHAEEQRFLNNHVSEFDCGGRVVFSYERNGATKVINGFILQITWQPMMRLV